MKNGPVIKTNPGEEIPSNRPKQYLQGWVEFYKLKFKVTPDVLIPRPESELLVDDVLAFIGSDPKLTNQDQKSKKGPTLIIDVGTGAGNIAISIAKNLPNAKIFATDISEEALEVARENAIKNKVEKRIFFLQSDLLDSISTGESLLIGSSSLQNDNLVIVTNLPYIPRARISYLDPSVRDFEPIIALDGGSDGFDLYRKLFAQMVEKNIIPKLFVGEIDYTQGEMAINEAQKYFPTAKVEVKTDLAKKQRILVIHWATPLK